MRVDLSEFQDGAWADMLDKVPYKVLKIAARVATSTSADDADKANYDALKIVVRDWNVKDVFGNSVKVPREASEDEFEMVDGFIITKLTNQLVNIVKESRPDPNLQTASSTS